MTQIGDRPRFLFAHGAGAGSQSQWMSRWVGYLEALGSVTRFDYPYMAAGRRAPDRMPKLLEAHRFQLETLRTEPGGPLILIGKSMGSRVGCHLSLTENVDALICLGYPLKGMGKAGKVRDEVLLALGTPILFVQGTRDNLCPLDLLATVRAKMSARNALHVVETGNHSLAITKTHTKTTGVTQDDADAAAVDVIRDFVVTSNPPSKRLL